MLFLYWFGGLIAEFVGGSRVTNLFILGGLAGGILFMILFNTMPFFSQRLGTSLLGASGGVFAVVFGAATLLPDYEFRIFLIGYVKIKYIALFYLVLSFIQLGGINSGGNIAHLGGALMGYLYIRSLQRGTDLGAWIQSVFGFFRSIFKPEKKSVAPKRKFFSEAPVKTPASNQGISQSKPSEFSVGQDEIDAILDKINRSGYESLSKEEKQKLFKASQQD
jgi:hypothetical protein